MKRLLVLLLILSGCVNQKQLTAESFVDIHWTRDGTHDSESIIFYSDGNFIYSCGCGNPVNDSDLCESYTFNQNTGEIHLEYDEATDETIDIIKIIKITNKTIELDFDGEIRIFEKQKEIN